MTGFFTSTGSAGLVDLLVRATILLSIALTLQWSLRKWPAVTRHRLWTLTFVLLLTLPALRQFGPSVGRAAPSRCQSASWCYAPCRGVGPRFGDSRVRQTA